MVNRSRQLKWIIVVGGIIFIGVLVHSSLQQTRFREEVCIIFRSRTNCATADGATEAEAIRSAQEIDCQLLANGRDENMACLDSQPSSIRKISGK